MTATPPPSFDSLWHAFSEYSRRRAHHSSIADVTSAEGQAIVAMGRPALPSLYLCFVRNEAGNGPVHPLSLPAFLRAMTGTYTLPDALRGKTEDAYEHGMAFLRSEIARQ